ncbi:MBL fold metallo-hydrolase [Sandaracinus amylolyticus]|uniref:Beta-lactamase related protein n=1 Tax=Sandaracinus amylolyticus TaxID=927083 RepID=A0A0F6YK92_9BACT|nr:MBL fold metallo-hydrolase [Sandaracinus amylolyticus]AKF09016.1 Beta-lactamase related protein [Sandaracinus amylolyticus]
MNPRLVTVDCDYVMPGLACAYLRVQGDEAAFVETNTAHAAPKLMDALAREGLAAEQVRWIVVTHVHLDHAGGTSALAKLCPNATVLAHPRAAKHLIDPAKLVASATQVYGADTFAKLYGTIEPIDAPRVRALDDGATFELGRSGDAATLRVLHTRGHANHHFVVHDPARDTVYTGDTFGLVYPHLQRAGRFAFPSTSPTEFDAAAARESIDRIVALGTRTVCPTHFGEVDRIEEIADQLRWWIDVSERAMRESATLDDGALEPAILAALEAAMEQALARRGLVADEDDRKLLPFDLALNAQGLAHVVRKARA